VDARAAIDREAIEVLHVHRVALCPSTKKGKAKLVVFLSALPIRLTPQCTYLGSMTHCSALDLHIVANRIRKTSAAFGALRGAVFGTRYVPLQAKTALHSSGALGALLYRFESWCLTQKGMLKPLPRDDAPDRGAQHHLGGFGPLPGTRNAAPCSGSATWRAWTKAVSRGASLRCEYASRGRSSGRK
jgi:hypothetical protein